MQITYKVEGLDRAIKRLTDLEKKHTPFAVAIALNETAGDVKKDEQTEMKKVFDNPTPFILNSMYISRADKKAGRFFVEVGFINSGRRSNAAKIMRPHILGGYRAKKMSEKHLGSMYVPGQAARLNKYGNISPGQVEQVLSVLGRSENWAGHTSNVTARSRARNRKPREYFALYAPKDDLKPGVYEKTKGGEIKPIMIFIKAAHYTKRFRFFEIAEACARRNFQRRFYAALARATGQG